MTPGNMTQSNPEYVTLPQLEALIDRVELSIVEGFKGVHHRQDITNGRVNKSEVLGGQHAIVLESVSTRLRHVEEAANAAALAAATAAGRAENAARAAKSAAKIAEAPYARAAKVGSVAGGALLALWGFIQAIWPVIERLVSK